MSHDGRSSAAGDYLGSDALIPSDLDEEAASFLQESDQNEDSDGYVDEEGRPISQEDAHEWEDLPSNN